MSGEDVKGGRRRAGHIMMPSTSQHRCPAQDCAERTTTAAIVDGRYSTVYYLKVGKFRRFAGAWGPFLSKLLFKQENWMYPLVPEVETRQWRFRRDGGEGGVDTCLCSAQRCLGVFCLFCV